MYKWKFGFKIVEQNGNAWKLERATYHHQLRQPQWPLQIRQQPQIIPTICQPQKSLCLYPYMFPGILLCAINFLIPTSCCHQIIGQLLTRWDRLRHHRISYRQTVASHHFLKSRPKVNKIHIHCWRFFFSLVFIIQLPLCPRHLQHLLRYHRFHYLHRCRPRHLHLHRLHL